MVAQTGILNLETAIDTTFPSISMVMEVQLLIHFDPLYNPNKTFLSTMELEILKNTLTKADEMTYQQLMDVISMATSGNLPKRSFNPGRD